MFHPTPHFPAKLSVLLCAQPPCGTVVKMYFLVAGKWKLPIGIHGTSDGSFYTELATRNCSFPPPMRGIIPSNRQKIFFAGGGEWQLAKMAAADPSATIATVPMLNCAATGQLKRDDAPANSALSAFSAAKTGSPPPPPPPRSAS